MVIPDACDRAGRTMPVCGDIGNITGAETALEPVDVAVVVELVNAGAAATVGVGCPPRSGGDSCEPVEVVLMSDSIV